MPAPGLVLGSICVFEHPRNHDGDGLNVLYADEDVDRIVKPQSDAFIQSIITGPNAPATQPAPH